MLERREASSCDIVRAHLDRIAAVDSRVRAFTDVLRERAMADAQASDARRARGETRGALDGVPMTFKECFDVAGGATTLGIPKWRARLADRDAAMIEAARASGAVVLGRTNLSQTMLFVESRNPLFGQTANPWSSAHTPGGSSGGEAAAIAAGMSPLGVGTDIGGSIRTPCSFTGVCGLKVTLDRLPMRGYRTVLAGQEVVRGMAGPMARTVDDLALFLRALDPHAMAALDARVPPLPMDDPARVRVGDLRVGVWKHDGMLAPSAAVLRAIDRSAAALSARGCKLDEFAVPDVRAMVERYLSALSADGGATLVEALEGGQVDPVLEPLRRIAAVPARARRVIASAASLFGQDGLALLLGALGEKSVAALWSLTSDLRAWRNALVDAMDRARIDVIVCPAYATPALPHGGSKGFTLASSYAMAFNAAQLPAGVVPVTRVRADETARTAGRDLLARRAARVDAASEGLPVGVQVVARAWREHVALAAMRAIEQDVARDQDFPSTPIDPR